MFVRLLLALPLLLHPAMALGQDDQSFNRQLEERYGGHESFTAAFSALQDAVLVEDREAVAALVNYPLRVTINGDRDTIGNPDEFVDRYDALITPDIAQLILGQDYDELTLDGNIVMFDGGDVWMRSYCTDSSCEVVYWLIRGLDPDGA
ncbi:hypothetical protein [Devosia pacifica]|uniref:hypothetical protein n=1 Tax=Devosia pacifica TaxID=1335967 RepID=UPI001672D714|nr:hypothetical protein [Devosia pacifica]